MNLGLSPLLQSLVLATLTLVLVFKLLIAAPRIGGLILLVPYFIFQSLNGFAGGAPLPSILSTLSAYLLIISLLNYLDTLEAKAVWQLLRHVTLGSICVLLAADALNWILRGRSIQGLLQIEGPLLFLSLMILVWVFPKHEDKNRMLWQFMVLFVAWIGVSLFLEDRIGLFVSQAISGGLMAVVLCFRLLSVISERISFHMGDIDLHWDRLWLMCSVIVLWIFWQDIFDFILSVDYRSSYERIAIVKSMYMSMLDSGWGFWNGIGFGSTSRLFDISKFLPPDRVWTVGEYEPHAGIFILLFENGVLGMLLLVLVFWVFLRNIGMRAYDHGCVGARDSVRNAALLTFGFWVAQNIFYAHGVPSPQVFFQSHIPQYCLLAAMLAKARKSSMVTAK